MADEDDAATLRFTITRVGSENENTSSKTLTLKVGSETPIRIGRAPGNDIIVDSRGVSQYHSELRLLRPGGGGAPSLCARDLSMNGTGLKRPDDPDGKPPTHLEKRSDTPLPDGSVLLVPMLLKVSQKDSDRGWLRVDFDGPAKAGEPAESRRASSSALAAPAQQAAAATGASNGRGAADPAGEADVEQCRMRFVELLLKTREVSAGTTYEEAKKLLSASTDWHAVDESTRKECFEIFVEHLGSHQSQKKKEKKKGKDKEKDKSKKQKHREEEEPALQKERIGRSPEPKAAQQGEEKKRRERRCASRSGSPDRKRKREKKGSRRSRSRPGARSGSGGGSVPRSKRRHRGERGGS